MSNLHYLAYGSNVHPAHLISRVESAAPIAIILLNKRSVQFNKISKDGSSKCSMSRLSEHETDSWGALYTIDTDQIKVLDQIEGAGQGYIRAQVSIEVAGELVPTYTYYATLKNTSDEILPYDWYRELVALGAEYFSFPNDYVNTIRLHADKPDLDLERAAEKAKLIQQIQRHPSASNLLRTGILRPDA